MKPLLSWREPLGTLESFIALILKFRQYEKIAQSLIQSHVIQEKTLFWFHDISCKKILSDDY